MMYCDVVRKTNRKSLFATLRHYNLIIMNNWIIKKVVLCIAWLNKHIYQKNFFPFLLTFKLLGDFIYISWHTLHGFIPHQSCLVTLSLIWTSNSLFGNQSILQATNSISFQQLFLTAFSASKYNQNHLLLFPQTTT